MFQIAQPSEVSTQTPEISKHQGIGSIVFDSGIVFRVWVPFAKIANFWASKPGKGKANEQLLLSVNLSLTDH